MIWQSRAFKPRSTIISQLDNNIHRFEWAYNLFFIPVTRSEFKFQVPNYLVDLIVADASFSALPPASRIGTTNPLGATRTHISGSFNATEKA